MEMIRYECVAEVMDNADGFRMAAGCICRRDYAEQTAEALRKLKDYSCSYKDPVGIDFDLAARMGSLAAPWIIAAGCSLCVPDARLLQGMTTGGVLGDPAEKAESSAEDIMDLSENFYMYTVPGGPGLAANTFGDTVRQALEEIRGYGFDGITEERFAYVLRKYGITVALLVYDGTGEGRHARIGTADLNGVRLWT